MSIGFDIKLKHLCKARPTSNLSQLTPVLPKPGPTQTRPTQTGPSNSANEQCIALATAAAQRHSAHAAAAATKFVQNRECKPIAAHPDGVPECDCATVDVGDLIGDAELSHRRNTHGSKRLVEFEQIDITNSLSHPRQCLENGPAGLMQQ